MSFLLATRGHKTMPWFYVIAPIKSGYGKIYLPVFFIFPVFLVSDFVSLLWEPNGVASNVAVSAHVGGAFMGLLMGLLYLFFRRKSAAHRVFSYDDGFHELS
jgi:membrane associated rhomboid family serine protease